MTELYANALQKSQGIYKVSKIVAASTHRELDFLQFDAGELGTSCQVIRKSIDAQHKQAKHVVYEWTHWEDELQMMEAMLEVETDAQTRLRLRKKALDWRADEETIKRAGIDGEAWLAGFDDCMADIAESCERIVFLSQRIEELHHAYKSYIEAIGEFAGFCSDNCEVKTLRIVEMTKRLTRPNAQG